MKKKDLLFILILFLPFHAFNQVQLIPKDVFIQGRVIHSDQAIPTLRFVFRDFLDNNLQKVYTTEPDREGNFKLTVPLLYAQDFFVLSGRTERFVCAPGDQLFFTIDTRKDESWITVTGGNRIEDNEDFSALLKEIPKNYFEDPDHLKAIKNYSPDQYHLFIKNQDSLSRAILKKLRTVHPTSEFFNGLAEDYIKFRSWVALMDFPGKHDEYDRVQRDEIVVPETYYTFLKDYDMNEHQFMSTAHTDFLSSYYRYCTKNPKDTLNKANQFFINKDIVSAAKVLVRMIQQNTNGFTENLFLTRMYLKALSGKQLKEFEAIYSSAQLKDPYFIKVVDRAHQELQQYLSNQMIEGSNLFSIDNNSIKSVLDTIKMRYSGKVIFVDFWAPWCGPCMKEMPYSKELQSLYKNKDVVFLFLANRCKEDAWKSTIANEKMGGDHILLTDEQYLYLASKLGINGIPNYLIIDKKGNIISKNGCRPSQKSVVQKEINKLLLEVP
jgi:thiol-disulfide isomerase/thioredoxin/mRNA-degrading endonuclease HigB of HigAB toxin-antitoxin module